MRRRMIDGAKLAVAGISNRVLVITAIALTLALAMAPRSAAAQPIKMYISGAGTVSAVAISPLKDLGGDNGHTISRAFTTTLRRDLELSGYFRILDPHAYIEDPQSSGFELGQFNFADWRSINADFLVKGAISGDGSNVKLTAYFYDVAQQRRMMGKSFTGAAADVPRMARRFADALLEATTGQKGPFDSMLAFASTAGGRFKEIYTQSIDGDNLFRLTDNPTINIFPSFDRSAHFVLYLSYKTMEPALYLADLQARRETRIDSAHGRTIGGALSPDGSRIVAAVEHAGTTNLFLLTREGGEIAQLTDTNGINVSPAISPDGSKIAFTSDRSGTPQIYLMPIEGGKASRVTFSGDYNTTPAFSPSGDRIAYQSRHGRFDIFVIPVGGGQPKQLSDSLGTNEYPTWSPDGRYIAFSSTRGGRPRIYVLMVNSQKIIGPLTEGKGDDTCPAWSGWLGD